MTPATHRTTAYERDGICAVRAFLPDADFTRVREDCRRLRGKMKREKDCLAVGRAGCFVDRRSETQRILTAAPVVARISRLVGRPMAPSPHPLELRTYRIGAEMAWHRDDQLHDDPQCELVLCLDNDSDSRTEWEDARGERFSEWTGPNLALLVRGGETGAPHRVTPLRRGERTILKMVWTVPGSAPRPELFDHLDSLPGLRRKAKRGVQKGGRRR
jgi:hypothetical protein